MSHTIYTATGCARCKIAKRYMKENNIAFEDFDIKAEGKDEFAQFYRANRKDIIRTKDGVEFPVFTDGRKIRQGVGVVLGYLIAESKLDGFIRLGTLHGEWIDGFDISGGDPTQTDDLIRVLDYLKCNGLKIQLNTNGKNADVLEKLLKEGLGDHLIMEVRGPEPLFDFFYGPETAAEQIRKSLSLASKFPDYSFFTVIAPVMRGDGEFSYLTAEEIGQTAELIEAASGSKKNPYTLRSFNPQEATDETFKSMEPLPSSAMFKYRTAARRYQVMTEIEK